MAGLNIPGLVPIPTPRPAQPEDGLTPGQMFGLQYSRDRYNDGSYQVNPGHRALQHEAQTGKKFARYPDIPSAEAGEQAVHRLMEQDSTHVLSWPESIKRLRGR